MQAKFIFCRAGLASWLSCWIINASLIIAKICIIYNNMQVFSLAGRIDHIYYINVLTCTQIHYIGGQFCHFLDYMAGLTTKNLHEIAALIILYEIYIHWGSYPNISVMYWYYNLSYIYYCIIFSYISIIWYITVVKL